MKQEWYCENCDVLSVVTIPRDADVATGLRAVTEAHKKKSPSCAFINQAVKVRIRAPHCTNAEWKAVRQDARSEAAIQDQGAISAIDESLKRMPRPQMRRVLTQVAERYGYRVGLEKR
jgi:NAD(P)H-nitrite reductase large subunit